jgi:hypothetical protein
MTDDEFTSWGYDDDPGPEPMSPVVADPHAVLALTGQLAQQLVNMAYAHDAGPVTMPREWATNLLGAVFGPTADLVAGYEPIPGHVLTVDEMPGTGGPALTIDGRDVAEVVDLDECGRIVENFAAILGIPVERVLRERTVPMRDGFTVDLADLRRRAAATADPRITHPVGWAWVGTGALAYSAGTCPRCGLSGADARCTCIFYLGEGWRWTDQADTDGTLADPGSDRNPPAT